jgi:16S rRNA (guanine527-N7)-methyltransferase
VTAPLATDQADAIAHGVKALGLTVSAGDVARLASHLALIEKWNAVHNLTAVRDPARMVTQHVLDSLSVSAHIPANATVLDVGSGAGFPGLPLAITRPDLQLTVLDSNQKKAAFLQHAIATLKIHNATSICTRVETWVTPQRFSIVLSRAFSELQEFAALARNMLATSGRLLAMKGVYPHDEIARLPPSVTVESIATLQVPGLDAERHLVIATF